MPVNHLWAAMNRDIEEALIVLNSITPLAERDINQLAEELCDQIYASVLRRKCLEVPESPCAHRRESGEVLGRGHSPL